MKIRRNKKNCIRAFFSSDDIFLKLLRQRKWLILKLVRIYRPIIWHSKTTCFFQLETRYNWLLVSTLFIFVDISKKFWSLNNTGVAWPIQWCLYSSSFYKRNHWYKFQLLTISRDFRNNVALPCTHATLEKKACTLKGPGFSN